MRFTIKKEEFAKSLNIVSKAVSNNSDEVILRNIKLDLTDNCLFLVGSNYSVTIKTFIPLVYVDKEIIRNNKSGSVLINAKHLIDTVNRIKTEEVIVEVVDNIAIITSDNGKSKKELNTIVVNEYPDIDLEPSGQELNISKADFIKLVNQTAFAASTKEKNILMAMNFEAANGELVVTATDSNRMAVKRTLINNDAHFVANISARTMIEVAHLIESDEEVHCYFGDKKVLFTFDRTVVSTSLIPGDYPNTKSILKRNTRFSLEINANELINAIESTRIMSIDRENIVDLSMNPDVVIFSAKSAQAGSAEEQIEEFKYDGEEFKISFNSEFVLSAVKGLGSQDIVMKFEGIMKPFVIVDPKDDSVIQIVTPVRTYN